MVLCSSYFFPSVFPFIFRNSSQISNSIHTKLAQSVMLLTYICELSGSNLSRDIDYSDWDYSWSFSVPPGTYQNSNMKIGHVSIRMLITVAARRKTWTVFSRSNTGFVGSAPTRGMNICVRSFTICVISCVGSGLATVWSRPRSPTECV
jgi:hypothetical protein